VNASVVLTVFVFVALAELPDKTMIATLIMGSRARPLFVWIGASLGFAVHVTLAVVAGHFLTLLPHRALEIIVTVIFTAGALYLLIVPERSQAERGEREAEGLVPDPWWKVVTTAFTVIVIGEFGDLTQLLTVNFVAKYHQPWSVFVGALAALMTVSAIGAASGRALVRVLPLGVIRRVGGIVLLGFAAYNLYSLVTS